jgi:hypothetical protein
MSTITVPRSDLTPDQVRIELSKTLPRWFQVIPGKRSTAFAKEVPAEPDALLVKGAWLARANVCVRPRSSSTEIDIVPGASYPGLIRLANRLGIVRRVQHALKNAYQPTHQT